MARILICDDEKDIVNALKIYLSQYELFEAYNGAEALKVLEEEKIDLILLDIMMPVMDGITALNEIRKSYNMPIILLTAKSEDADKVLGLNVGADDYICKPFNPLEVVARVKSSLRRFYALGGGEEQKETVTVHTIRATDVVNIRSSDSETADILDKTTKGQEFKQLEALANGWSKIEYKGGVAYVKTEYFEVIDEQVVEAGTDSEAAKDDKTTTDSNATKDTSAKTGKMKVNDSVRLRKEQSTDSDVLAMIYSGSTVNVVEQYSNGWAKVEYNGSTGYVKSEFLGN